jgi:hypothetical protein
MTMIARNSLVKFNESIAVLEAPAYDRKIKVRNKNIYFLDFFGVFCSVSD